MHSALSAYIATVIDNAAALERQQEAISQVLGILSDPCVGGLMVYGGGGTPPFISATVAQGQDEAAIMAALASIGLSESRDSERQNGHIWRLVGTIPSTGVAVFLEVRRALAA